MRVANSGDTILLFVFGDVFQEKGEKDGEKMQGVDYSKLTPILLKAIQEQQEIINDLKSRIEQLEN